MKNKKKRYNKIYLVCILFIFLFTSINAEQVNSNKFVKGDSSLPSIFGNINSANNLISQPNFIGLQIINNTLWANVFVTIKDTSGIILVGTKEEKREWVNRKIELMTKETEKVLNDYSGQNFILLGKTSGSFGMKVTKEGFDKLINDLRIEEVSWVQNKPEFNLKESIPLIKANDTWALGYNGSGIKVCVIDTGIDTDNLDLKNRIVAQKCYNSDNHCPNNQNNDTSAEDAYGHGTRVAGVIASQDDIYQGIAYGVKLYIVRVTNNNGNFSSSPFVDIWNAIDWCRNQNVDVISMSFRFGPYSEENCPNDLTTPMYNAYNSEITLVASSGNDAKNNQTGYPACSPLTLSVGGSYDAGTGSQQANWDTCTDYPLKDTVACWSNTDTNLDLVAPGAMITTTAMGGGTVDVTGTSYSAPMVAGAVALLLEKNSSLTPEDIRSLLYNTGVWVPKLGTSGPLFKRINILSAINSICVCTNWTYTSCGTGDCLSSEKSRSRTCNPSGCSIESVCVLDDSCSSGGGGGEGTSEELTVCASGCNSTTIQGAVRISDANDKIFVLDNRTYTEEIVMNSTSSGWLDCGANGSKIIDFSGRRGIGDIKNKFKSI